MIPTPPTLPARHGRAPETDVEGLPELTVRDDDREALEDLLAELLVAAVENVTAIARDSRAAPRQREKGAER